MGLCVNAKRLNARFLSLTVIVIIILSLELKDMAETLLISRFFRSVVVSVIVISGSTSGLERMTPPAWLRNCRIITKDKTAFN